MDTSSRDIMAGVCMLEVTLGKLLFGSQFPRLENGNLHSLINCDELTSSLGPFGCLTQSHNIEMEAQKREGTLLARRNMGDFLEEVTCEHGLVGQIGE